MRGNGADESGGVVLLGPQRAQPTVRDAVRDLTGVDRRPIAVITAGWEEREAEIDELGEHLEREVINLAVYHRGEDIYARDRELHEAMRHRHDQLTQLREIYQLRLRHTSPIARMLLRRKGDDQLLDPEREAAIEALRQLDDQHLAHVNRIQAAFAARWRLAEREHVIRHRGELAAVLAGVGALCIAGGHVGILMNRMRLLGFPDLFGDLPLIAWSAGAMVLSQRIVLFHDSPPQGKGHAEVLERGFARAPGVVVFPHAQRRLLLADRHRVAILARRFRPAACITLDAGARVDCAAEPRPVGETSVMQDSGELCAAGVAG